MGHETFYVRNTPLTVVEEPRYAFDAGTPIQLYKAALLPPAMTMDNVIKKVARAGDPKGIKTLLTKLIAPMLQPVAGGTEMAPQNNLRQE